MAEGMDPVTHNTTTQERQYKAMPKLQDNQSHQPPQQSNAKNYTQ